MHQRSHRILLSLAVLPLACAGPQRMPAPAQTVAEPPPLRCAFLEGELAAAPRDERAGSPRGPTDCTASAFLQDQVDLLVRGLARDPDWGAIVSPELQKEGQLVIVANVVPSLDYYRRRQGGEVSDEVHALVESVQRSLENRLFRRTVELAQRDGSTKQASFQQGQLRGGTLNDYMEYLAQAGQSELAEPFFVPYDAVTLEGRAARTGLLWLVSAKPRPNGEIAFEFRIETFEMERGPEGKKLIVRGQLADRTGQLLGVIHTAWAADRVRRLEPEPAEVPSPAAPLPKDPPLVAQAEAGGAAEPRDVPLLPPADSPGPAADVVDGEGDRSDEALVDARPPEPTRAGRPPPPLRLTVARLTPRSDGRYALRFGRGPLPVHGELFALVFLNDHAEQVAFILGEAGAEDGPRALEVPIASAESDKSAILAASAQSVSLALSSVFEHAPGESPYLLVLRRNRPWSLSEQGAPNWACDPATTYRLDDLPDAPLRTSSVFVDWVKGAIAKQMQASLQLVETSASADASAFAAVPIYEIPDGRSAPDAAACIVLPFASAHPQGGA